MMKRYTIRDHAAGGWTLQYQSRTGARWTCVVQDPPTRQRIARAILIARKTLRELTPWI